MGPPFLILLFFGFSILNDVSAGPINYVAADTNVYKPEHCLQMSPQKEEEINSIIVKLTAYLYNLTLEYDELDVRLIKIVVESHSEDETEEKETNVQLVVNDCVPADNIDTSNTKDLIDGSTVESDDLDSSADDEVADTDVNNATSSSQSSDVKKTTSSQSTQVKQSSAIKSDSQSSTVESESVTKSTDENSITSSDSVVNSGGVKSESSSRVDTNDLSDSVLIVDNCDDVDVDSCEDAGNAEVMRLNLDDTGNRIVELYEEKYGHVPLLLYVTKALDSLQYFFLN